MNYRRTTFDHPTPYSVILSNTAMKYKSSTFDGKPVIIDTESLEVVVYMTDAAKAESLAKQWNIYNVSFDPTNPFQVARLYMLAKRHEAKV